MRASLALLTLVVGIMASLIGVSAGAEEEKPDRLMPFLCRDAVVRESVEKMVLVVRH